MSGNGEAETHTFHLYALVRMVRTCMYTCTHAQTMTAHMNTT